VWPVPVDRPGPGNGPTRVTLTYANIGQRPDPALPELWAGNARHIADPARGYGAAGVPAASTRRNPTYVRMFTLSTTSDCALGAAQCNS